MRYLSKAIFAVSAVAMTLFFTLGIPALRASEREAMRQHEEMMLAAERSAAAEYFQPQTLVKEAQIEDYIDYCDCTVDDGADVTATSLKSVSVKQTVPKKTKTASKKKRETVDESLKDYVWMGWTYFESGDASWKLTASDGGHAYGRYQFDDRYCLPDFLRYCVKNGGKAYDGFTNCFRVQGGKARIRNLDRLPEEWKWVCHQEGDGFYDLQTEFALKAYYQPALKTLKGQKIQLNGYSPVLRGTVMSVAIRNGTYEKGLSSVINTYEKGITETEWLAQIYAAEAARHPDQRSRWQVKERKAAMKALKAVQQNKRKSFAKHSLEAVL